VLWKQDELARGQAVLTEDVKGLKGLKEDVKGLKEDVKGVKEDVKKGFKRLTDDVSELRRGQASLIASQGIITELFVRRRMAKRKGKSFS
jgi:uncharacterized protein YoxC